MNPYEVVIDAVIESIRPVLHPSAGTWVLGFGAAECGDSGTNYILEDFTRQPEPAVVQRAYRSTLRATALGPGPTSFAPVLNRAVALLSPSLSGGRPGGPGGGPAVTGGARVATSDVGVVAILTDGPVARPPHIPSSEFSPQEIATIQALRSAARLPLLVVVVGIGDGPWEKMHEFLRRLRQYPRAVAPVEFVALSDVFPAGLRPDSPVTLRSRSMLAATILRTLPTHCLRLRTIDRSEVPVVDDLPDDNPAPILGDAESVRADRRRSPRGAPLVEPRARVPSFDIDALNLRDDASPPTDADVDGVSADDFSDRDSMQSSDGDGDGGADGDDPGTSSPVEPIDAREVEEKEGRESKGAPGRRGTGPLERRSSRLPKVPSSASVTNPVDPATLTRRVIRASVHAATENHNTSFSRLKSHALGTPSTPAYAIAPDSSEDGSDAPRSRPPVARAFDYSLPSRASISAPSPSALAAAMVDGAEPELRQRQRSVNHSSDATSARRMAADRSGRFGGELPLASASSTTNSPVLSPLVAPASRFPLRSGTLDSLDADSAAGGRGVALPRALAPLSVVRESPTRSLNPDSTPTSPNLRSTGWAARRPSPGLFSLTLQGGPSDAAAVAAATSPPGSVLEREDSDRRRSLLPLAYIDAVAAASTRNLNPAASIRRL